MSPNTDENLALIESFKAYYRDIAKLNVDDMASLYHSEIVFKDPVHDLRGINELHSYMQNVSANVKRGRFEYLDQLVVPGKAYIKWNMYFEHSKLGSKVIVVRGMSHVEFSEKIHFHEDVYDMGALLYEHLPLLGGATRWLKARLSR
ncbi:SnoaL-like domain-containing protein [Alteromonadaceae bacterium Bs31]|nr:SnoaL-like domain-containing protein [Alteromonadaceae bacterium Bs31]